MVGTVLSSDAVAGTSSVCERSNGDRDLSTGRFAAGNKAAAGRRKHPEADVKIPPVPQSLVMADLDAIWPGVFRKAAAGSTPHVELVLRFRKADAFDLIGENELDELVREADRERMKSK